MIDIQAVGEIIAIYKKHGWLLRRVLLSARSAKALAENIKELFGDVPVSNSKIDAAWFSRPAKEGAIAWEIRYLGDIPFAMLEHLDENDVDFEAALTAVEEQLREKIAAGNIRLTTATPDSKL